MLPPWHCMPASTENSSLPTIERQQSPIRRYYLMSVLSVMQSVIDRPLLERLDLLKAAIQPPPEEGIPVGRGTVQGRLAKLVPNEFVLDHTTCSKICHTMEDIQAAFDEAIRVQVIMAEAAKHLHVSAGYPICLLCCGQVANTPMLTRLFCPSLPCCFGFHVCVCICLNRTSISLLFLLSPALHRPVHLHMFLFVSIHFCVWLSGCMSVYSSFVH